MLLHDSRRATRIGADGMLLLLDEQDRTQWNHAQIAEGVALTERALRERRIGPYALQAAIAALHAEAPAADATDWRQIVGLYDLLVRVQPSPVIRLNRAAAVAMADGDARGLAAIDALLEDGSLETYPHAHGARATLLHRMGRRDDALTAYRLAHSLTSPGPQRRFFDRRIAEIERERE
jgi:RNA polymerase sigma-70 factor (ECF subfamily)